MQATPDDGLRKIRKGIIPLRTNKIFKIRILNLNNPVKELNVNKIHRANNFLYKKKKKDYNRSH